MARRLSKHCLYVNSQHSESFKEALWNVSDSHGESLLQLKCFSKEPQIFFVNAGKYGVFLFVYIKRHVNKEAVSICSLLGGDRFSSQAGNLFVRKKKKREKLFRKYKETKTVKIWQGEKMQHPIYQPKNIYI